MVFANRCRASAVSNQDHSLESPSFGELNPGGEVSHLLAGYTPVTTAADPFSPSVSLSVSQVMHARVAADAGVATLSEARPIAT